MDWEHFYAAIQAFVEAGEKTVVEMLYKAKSGHTGGSLSVVEIMTVLYYDYMKIDPKNPKWEGRDRFVVPVDAPAPGRRMSPTRCG